MREPSLIVSLARVKEVTESTLPLLSICSAGRTRTYNQWINSPLLCQLSYRGRHAGWRGNRLPMLTLYPHFPLRVHEVSERATCCYSNAVPRLSTG